MTSLSDFRLALRSFRKSPGFTLVAVATLALAIGANTAIFSVVHAALLARFPFREADRLVTVWENNAANAKTKNVVNPGNYIRWTERNRSFESLASMTPWVANLSGAGGPVRVKIGDVSGNFFSTFGGGPLAGRLLGTSDATPQSPEVVVLSEGFWRRQFGSDPAVVGRDVHINGVTAKVVGIAGNGFDVPQGTEVWSPMAFGASWREAPGRYLSVVGRLRKGVSITSASAEMASIAAALEKERPDIDAGWGTTVIPLREDFVGGFRTGLLILMGAVGCLLLIGCANLTNLLLARGAARRREFAVRAALGASRARLVRLLLAESLLLAVAGGAAGVVVGSAGIRALLALVPAEFPDFLAVRISVPVLAFTAGISIAVGCLIGLVPALRLERGRLPESLHAAGSASAPRSTFAAVLVGLEVAGSVVLLTGAVLLLRSLSALWNVDPGFRTRNVLTFRLDLPRRGYEKPEKIAAFYRAVEEGLRALPGVESVGGVSWLPLGGGGAATSFHTAGSPAVRAGDEPVADIRVVTPGFFRAAGIPLLRGRLFGADDGAGSPLRAVVSRDLAKTFGSQDPIGRRLWVSWGSDPKGETVEIVGVAGDVRLSAPDTDVRPAIYFPQEQQPNNFMTMFLTGTVEPASLGPPIRRLVNALDPELPVADLRPMQAVVADALRTPRFFSTLLATFSALAFLLAVIGVYGVVQYSTARRTREIGIRVALGGRPADVFRLVLTNGMGPVAVGAAAGIAGSLGVGRIMKSLLFGVSQIDPLSIAMALVLLTSAAILACSVPALRAARVDPALALRTE